MSRTNQAFIHAFGQAASSGGVAGARDAAAAPGPTPRVSFAHGPHLGSLAADGTSARTPLAQAIALRRRMADAAASDQSAHATQVRRFAWPLVVERLVERHAEAFRGLAPAPAAEPFVLGVAGLHRGGGATTIALAIARCLARPHQRVVIIDAETGLHEPAGHGAGRAAAYPGDGLAAAVGLLRTRSIADLAASRQPPAAALVHAEEHSVGVAVAGDLRSVDGAAALAAMSAVTAGYALVLLDLGPIHDQATAWRQGPLASLVAATRPAGVILVRQPRDLTGTVSAAQRVVESTGAAALGVVENRVEPADC